MLIHAQRGVMSLREGRLTEARAELDVAVTMLDFAPAKDQGKILINRGEVLGLLGEVGAAKADCARALDLAEAYALPGLSLYARHNLGWFEFLSGDLPRRWSGCRCPTRGPRLRARRGGVRPGQGAAQRRPAQRGRPVLGGRLCRAGLDRAGPVPGRGRADLAEVALLAERIALAQTTSHAAVDRLRPRDNHRATALGELVQLQAPPPPGCGR